MSAPVNSPPHPNSPPHITTTAADTDLPLLAIVSSADTDDNSDATNEDDIATSGIAITSGGVTTIVDVFLPLTVVAGCTCGHCYVHMHCPDDPSAVVVGCTCGHCHAPVDDSTDSSVDDDEATEATDDSTVAPAFDETIEDNADSATTLALAATSGSTLRLTEPILTEERSYSLDLRRIDQTGWKHWFKR